MNYIHRSLTFSPEHDSVHADPNSYGWHIAGMVKGVFLFLHSISFISLSAFSYSVE